jgi:chromosomal replication initiation ATPase DnaA
VQEARSKAPKSSGLDRSYSLKRIVQAVCRVNRVAEVEIKRARRKEEVQRARELICYLARRHSDTRVTRAGAISRCEGVVAIDSAAFSPLM